MTKAARWGLGAVASVLLFAAPARAEQRTFAEGSLIIPMDLSYQDHGMFQSYGLVFQLLKQGVPVSWVIDPQKTWHAAPCDTPGDECAWDCEIEGAGQKCAYPTASPDFFATTEVAWDGEGLQTPGDAIASHGYRGGPFVVAAAHRADAMAIIDIWNDPTTWAANPWAQRSVFQVVTVHEATAPFMGFVTKDMLAAPTVAVFADGNEDIAAGYLRAAGIPQSNGAEFPAAKCGAANCGPGTANPDMLSVASVAGDMGTCAAPSSDHENGALFTADGLPAYCQIMSMHWNVADRETVLCDDGACPATQAQCGDEVITYHGHEVVAEVRSFLSYPTHFFAECQAVNAYENTTPNPAWPFLDDAGRDGHFLTTRGTPPPCPCTDADFQCVVGGCGGADCCLPRDLKEKGAGFMIAAQPASASLKVLRPGIAYAQLDGQFETVGGSEPAYNLSDYLGTEYKNGREVTFITGPNGPGDQDVWMTGYVDGTCDIASGNDDIGGGTTECTGGKVSYLGGHSYSTGVPISASGDSQGARQFMNALFEADCVTAAGQPQLDVSLTGDIVVAAQTVPTERSYAVGYANSGAGAALEGLLHLTVASNVEVTDAVDGSVVADGAAWSIGAISGVPTQAGDPPSADTRASTLRFTEYGDTEVTVELEYRVGSTILTATRTVTVQVALDSDGDNVADITDPAPNDPNACGDQDSDTCDDCTNGLFDPGNDGADADSDGVCNAGEADGPGADDDDGGCGCRVAAASDAGGGVGASLLGIIGLVIVLRRRAPSRSGR